MNAVSLRTIHTPSPNSGPSAKRHVSTVVKPHLYGQISDSREQAASDVKQITKERFSVFTDGAAYRKGVGGAARAETPWGTVVKKERLGSKKRHYSVEGEMLGVILGLEIINMVPSVTEATIFIDCQQAIRELVSGKSKHKALIERFEHEVRSLRKSISSICLAWVPGHAGIELNELVDMDAKAAAVGK